MFDTFIFDTAFIQTTAVFVLLLSIALWQKLKQFAGIMFGIYIIFLVFSIFDTNDKSPITVNKTEDSLVTTPIQEINLIDEVENEMNEVVSDINEEIIVPTIKEKIKLPDDKSKELSKTFNIDTNNESNTIVSVPKRVIEKQQDNSRPILIKYLKLGRELRDRELIDIDSTFFTTDDRIYCMTKIQNQNNGKIIYHNWYFNSRLVSKIRMEIGWSYNWRTWSYINVNPERAGEWKVVISDTLNVRYDSLSFSINPF